MVSPTPPVSFPAPPSPALSNSELEGTLHLPGFPGGVPELDAYFHQHAVPDPVRDQIRTALCSDPLRRVGGGFKNAVVRYASPKLGCVVQAESRTVEAAFVQSCEFDPAVVSYVCQPLTLSVRYRDARGRHRTLHTVVDFLKILRHRFVVVECKGREELERDSKRPHPRFVRDGARWRWPAAEEAARALGLEFELFTSEDVNPIWLRNMRFLAAYLEARTRSDAPELRTVIEHVQQAGTVRLEALFALPGVSSDVVWALVAHRQVWCDLEHERVFEPDQAWAHDSEARMLAQRHARSASASAACAPQCGDPAATPPCVEPGARVLWDGVAWTVLQRGESAVELQRLDDTRRVVSVPHDDVERYLRTGAWRGEPTRVEDAKARARADVLCRASSRDLSLAAERYAAVRHYLQHGRYPAGLAPRVGRRFLGWYREGERVYGSGFVGLVRFRGRPPNTPALPAPQAEALAEVVEQYRDAPRAGRLCAVYSRLTALCKERGVDPVPCEETLRRALKKATSPASERARRGARAAYQRQGPAAGDYAGALRHGDRVFEVGHIDHTPLDVRLIASKSGTPLGSPWLTLFFDAYSRMPLAFVLSFNPPSRASVCAVLYDCVHRHHRLPDTIVLDQGAEFNSVLTESVLAYLGVHKLERPAGAARFGSVIERMFHTINTRFVHELVGNTKLLALGRGLSASHHPSKFAAWTLPMLHDALERWLFEVYPGLVHSTLGETPCALFERSLARSGERVARYVAADFGLRILLAQPPPRGGTRSVHATRGIVTDYLRYWHDEFQYGDVAGTEVPVKLDVVDCASVFAYVRGRWVTCRLIDGDADLHGRSWRQIRMAIDGLAKQRKNGRDARPINAERIGAFLREADARSEIALQTLRDAEARGLGTLAQSAPARSLRLVTSDGVRTNAAPSPGATPDDDDDLSDFGDLKPFDDV